MIEPGLYYPRSLVISAWLWLAADAEELDEKRRCLKAVLELNPESQAARAGLALLRQRDIGQGDTASIADKGCQC